MPESDKREEGGGRPSPQEHAADTAKLPPARPARRPTLLDISRPLSASTPAWPGDAPTAPAWTARLADGASVNVGQLASSLHAATHADAPLHFSAAGAPIDQVDLSAYFGEACVLERIGTGPIRPDEVERALHHVADLSPRVLFRTWPGAPPETWVDDFACFDPASIHLLADQGVVLIGIDTPSFDPVDSKALPSHHALLNRGILNLENLDLSRAVVGRTYTLSAFPLRVEGMDASPVRAVLIGDD